MSDLEKTFGLDKAVPEVDRDARTLRVAMTWVDAYAPNNVYWDSKTLASLWRALHDTHTDESRAILQEALQKPADEMNEDLAMRDMEAAMDTVAACRLAASQYRQIGFGVYADWLSNNAKEAEKWLVRAGKVYPNRCPV